MEKTVISLTEEEVTKINVLQSGILQSLARLGEIEIEKLELESVYKSLNEETDQLISRYNTLKENERKLAQELKQKYGEGGVDLENNTFVPKQ
jgi:predicted nuclease with TOPRIM domain